MAVVVALVTGGASVLWAGLLGESLGHLVHERIAEQLSVLGIALFVGGALVGAVAPPQWPMSALCAWGTVLLGVFGLALFVANPTVDVGIEVVTFLVAAPAVALLGGYVGVRFVRWFSRP